MHKHISPRPKSMLQNIAKSWKICNKSPRAISISALESTCSIPFGVSSSEINFFWGSYYTKILQQRDGVPPQVILLWICL
ncbi:Os12g0429950 [Oryza sativa Japonica Group]|uniref:Os12g0429950 protein n=1 Tax=Oryza sativa subsp. japonica TaxID=39947 RepID=A0A0P0Y9I0_ORYSJ|nr:hypothetical protein EE612_059268 [Oryza sativa]BAT16939.1 Os12g0429950 [Oryza sativa Japonica Group]